MVEPQKDGSFDHFGRKIGAKSRKSLRYDQGALARRGNITVEILIDFEEVRMACLPPVWLRLSPARLWKIPVSTPYGNEVSFLNSFPNWQSPPACGFHFYESMINRLPGNELLGPGYSISIILPMMKSGRNIPG